MFHYILVFQYVQKLQNSTARVATRSPSAATNQFGGPREGAPMNRPLDLELHPVRAAGRDDLTRAPSVQAFGRARSQAAAAKRLRRAPQIDPPLPPPAPCAEGW
jgi:hypothetical protein